MGLLGNIFGLVDDIVSIPTDIVGLTNHHAKKKAMKIATTGLIEGKITMKEYKELVEYIENQ